jgi:carbonic anhydrase
MEIENNGHSLEALPEPGNSLEVDGTEYELEQFHFHAPSEHEIDGEPAAMEFHFLNVSEDGDPFVLGVLVKEGQANPAAAKLVTALPPEEGETLPVGGEVDPIDLLPPDPESAPRWHYDGSLTTPPCTEGADWNVYEQPIEMSAEQIDAYTSIYGDNRRPLQPLNGRELTLSR